MISTDAAAENSKSRSQSPALPTLWGGAVAGLTAGWPGAATISAAGLGAGVSWGFICISY